MFDSEMTSWSCSYCWITVKLLIAIKYFGLAQYSTYVGRWKEDIVNAKLQALSANPSWEFRSRIHQKFWLQCFAELMSISVVRLKCLWVTLSAFQLANTRKLCPSISPYLGGQLFSKSTVDIHLLFFCLALSTQQRQFIYYKKALANLSAQRRRPKL